MDSSARKIFQKGDSCRTMPPVQLPRQLHTLHDLRAQSEHYANNSMRIYGRVPPPLFLIGADGPLAPLTLTVCGLPRQCLVRSAKARSNRDNSRNLEHNLWTL